jgi:hypothetical protein
MFDMKPGMNFITVNAQERRSNPQWMMKTKDKHNQQSQEIRTKGMMNISFCRHPSRRFVVMNKLRQLKKVTNHMNESHNKIGEITRQWKNPHDRCDRNRVPPCIDQEIGSQIHNDGFENRDVIMRIGGPIILVTDTD